MLPAVYGYMDMVFQGPTSTHTSRVWGVWDTPPESVAQLKTTADAVLDILGPQVKNCLSASMRFGGANFVWTQNGLQLDVFSSVAEGVGNNAANMLPESDCMIIQKRTGHVGRNKRGRYFIPGIAEGDTTTSYVTAGTDTHDQLKNLADMLGADIGTGANIWHQRHLNRKDGTLDVVTSCRPLAVIGSRRDRRQHLHVSNSYYG